MLFKMKSKKIKGTIIFSAFNMIVGLSLFFVFSDNFAFINNWLHLSNPIKQLNGVYEPSAVQQLKNGRILVLEDEVSRALSLLEFDSEGNLLENAINDKQLNAKLKESFDDLEGVALRDDTVIYATTSFSRTSKGKRRPNREKLLRLVFDNNGELLNKDVYPQFLTFLESSELIQTLKLESNGAIVDLQEINIEGLSFNKDNSQLLFGFKKPVVNDLSLIVHMENPKQVLDGSEQPILSQDATLLDLQGGGIRSLFYDKRLQGYLIANEVNYGGGSKQSQLWFWSGDDRQLLIALVLPEIADMENIEAITAINVAGDSKVLIMSDDGSRRNKRPAHFAMIEYAEIESQIPTE